MIELESLQQDSSISAPTTLGIRSFFGGGPAVCLQDAEQHPDLCLLDASTPPLKCGNHSVSRYHQTGPATVRTSDV